MTRCERCDQGERRVVTRAKMAERAGHVAIVLEVPMEECAACGERYLDWHVAARLDELLTGMLAGDAEVATRHFEASTAA